MTGSYILIQFFDDNSIPTCMPISENTFKEGPILDSTQEMTRMGVN